jgi:hypothetical protein
MSNWENESGTAIHFGAEVKFAGEKLRAAGKIKT